MLKTLILSAAAAGVAAGIVTAALQHVTTTPIIIEAEKYEGGGAAHDHAFFMVPDEAEAVTATHGEAAADDEEAWAPADGGERTVYTSLATFVIGVGCSLMLLGAMVFAGVRIDWRSGLAFGAAGYVAVGLAPALGLPPEIPGSGAAALIDRQIWWLFAVIATAAGIAALLLSDRIAVRLAGVVLIAAPHIVGAPHPAAYVSTAPAELAGHFAAASLVVTAVFWAVLGSASGALYQRFSESPVRANVPG
jgi:cobalt transporter subunit CbtA